MSLLGHSVTVRQEGQLKAPVRCCRSHPSKHGLQKTAFLVVIMLLRATDHKYRESVESCKISLFVISFPEGTL